MLPDRKSEVSLAGVLRGGNRALASGVLERPRQDSNLDVELERRTAHRDPAKPRHLVARRRRAGRRVGCRAARRHAPIRWLQRSRTRTGRGHGLSATVASPERLRADTPVVSRRALPVAAPLVVLLAIVVAATVLLSTTHSKTKLPGGVKRTSAAQGYRGGLVSPVKVAPPISLDNYLGQHVRLSQYRGKAVLVTFLYTHCPDVCPLIASSLKIAETKLGSQAGKVQVIAVSVDPRGDTRQSVADFLRSRGIEETVQYLVGSASRLGGVCFSSLVDYRASYAPSLEKLHL